MTRAVEAVVALLLLVACHESPDARARPADEGVAGLPRLDRDGKSSPYTRYADAAPNSTNGRIFFFHPMMGERNGVFGIEGDPNAPIAAQFAEDMLGASGPVSVQAGNVRVEFLPISLPIGVKAGQEWTLRYARRDFTCRSREAGPPHPRALGVTCTSGQYGLSFRFVRDRGILEYQDFCGRSVCTFRLIDGEGLLSRRLLDFMGLPRI